ncbi:MAG: PhnD/SsuA/transferrin family substrate-binding protein [Oleispira sp.]|nr:PhnD/SsuA/transferrin family substrate-binding protein [Oleispira sp.]
MNHKCLFITLALSGLFPIQVSAEALTFSVDGNEGGRLKQKSISQFEHYMAINHCPLTVINPSQLKDKSQSIDLFFSVQPNASLTKPGKHYEVINKAVYQDGLPLTITILINTSTGINDLASVQGERLAIISHRSLLGGKQTKALLADVGVVLSNDDIYETGNYLGAMSLLLHGDVFIAAIPGPLARRWQTHNNLSIIAESEAFELGEILIKRSIKQALKDNCRRAFSSLNKDNRRDKKLGIFPAWLMGFE